VGWIILYLFGASPAICKNFFKSRPSLMAQFEQLDNGTLYHPYATSLRMSDIGYKSKNQASLSIDYNSVEGYVASLSAAINTPFEDYEKIGVVVDGEYKQLNSNVLQIENEFYSIIRPKQIAQSCEKPTLALKRRGVRYVEMRSLDLNLFEPLGLSIETARFIEALLLSCALQDSPDISISEHKVNNSNQLIVANCGRKPNLQLIKGEQSISLQDWANEIVDAMLGVCEILDNGDSNKPYSNALIKQRAVINNADLTPSAQLLAMMKTSQQPFAKVALELSRKHADNFNNQQLDEHNKQLFEQAAAQSHLKQQEIESRPQAPFDEFLQCYFKQH
jgi:glutamate--cysteine ligase